MAYIITFILSAITKILETVYKTAFNGVMPIISRPDLKEFEVFVPGITAMYDLCLGIGWGLFIVIVAFQALKTMLSGVFETEGENPSILAIRAIIFGVGVMFCSQIIWFILDVPTKIVELIGNGDADIKVYKVVLNSLVPQQESFIDKVKDVYNKLTDPLADPAGVVINIGLWIVLWNLLKLLFQMAERWVILALLILVAPMAFATGATRNTSYIFTGWARALGGQIFSLLFSLMVYNLIMSACDINDLSPTKAVIWFMIIIGLTKASRKIEEWMMQIGMIALRSAGLGFGAAMTFHTMMKLVKTSVSMYQKHQQLGLMSIRKGSYEAFSRGGRGGPEGIPRNRHFNSGRFAPPQKKKKK